MGLDGSVGGLEAHEAHVGRCTRAATDRHPAVQILVTSTMNLATTTTTFATIRIRQDLDFTSKIIVARCTT